MIDQQCWQEHAWQNRLQTLLLLCVLAGFSALMGYMLWGREGIILLVSFVLVFMLTSPTFSPWIIMRMYRATRLSNKVAPELFHYLQILSSRADLPVMPEVYIVPSRILNAFAVGNQSRPAIALTEGMLNHLNQRELLGVLAHEISHIRSNDLWIMGLADTFSRMTSYLSLFGQLLLLINLPLILFSSVSINWFAILLMIIAPNVSALVQLALSRTREFDADLNAVRLTNDPDGLSSALAKIENLQGGWLERIFLPGRRVPEPSLLRTHPPTEERIKKLASLNQTLDIYNYPRQDFVRFPEWRLSDSRIRHRKPRWHTSGLWY